MVASIAYFLCCGLLVVMSVYAAFDCWFVVVLAVAVWVSLLLRWFGLVNSVGLLVF